MRPSESGKQRSKSGPPTLSASDFAGESIKLTIVEAEVAPEGWTAPSKLTFKPAVKSLDKARGQITILGVNQTNNKTLIEKFGDEYDDWPGKKITLVKVGTTNPKTNKPTLGLRVLAG